MKIGALRLLASLQSASVAPTAFGGESVSWDEIATLWVALETTSTRRSLDADQAPVAVISAQATARCQDGVEVGQRLVVNGDNWRIVRLARGAPMLGSMTLFLEIDQP